MRKKVLLLLLFLAPIALHAQINKAKLDSLFDAVAANQKGMGVVSLYQEGKEVYSRAIGFSDVEKKTPNNAQTKFRIGSITKTFTAAIILQLVDDGKLSLSTKLDQFFPQIPNASKITIEHLLRHRSGLFNVTSSADYPAWSTQPQSKEQMLARFVANGTVFEPDTKMQYSNTNFILLGYIAEKIDQKSYADMLQKRICTPLKLNDTSVGGRISSPSEAFSYQWLSGWIKSGETDMSVPGAAGSITSTPSDVNRFFSALLTGKLISASSLEAMKQMDSGAGLGLFQFPFNDKRAYGHTGGIDGFSSITGYFPNEKFQMTYLSNGVNMVVNDLTIGILSISFDRPYAIPTFAPALKVTPEKLELLLGIYSSPTFPLKITVSRKDNILTAQATGQSSFPLEAVSEVQFKFDPANITLKFDPERKTMLLTQGPNSYQLTRE